MKNFTTCICILGLSGTAFGAVVMDQIGPDDGSGVGTNITGCQDFEDAYNIYDIATMDNFTGAGENINMVEMCLNGWNGFVDPSSVHGYTANLHSDPAAAALDLIGDIGSSYADAADATQSTTWAGGGFVVAMPAEMTAAAGTNWVSMIPGNDFATGGQTGTADSLSGDGVMGWQANPGGGFGMPGNMQEMTNEAAYRVHSGAAADPCDSALPMPCPEDINMDGNVTVSDVLAVIGSWGTCGDGTYRPDGDVAPLPNGDCCVNVSDVLGVVGAFGGDCSVYGGCCLGDGSCSVETSADCAANGGVYFGDNSTCADGDCSTGACCLSDMSCADMTADGCSAVGGTLHGNDDCSTWDCSVATPGDECVDAVAAVDGANPFDTTSMTPSQPQPDDSMCSTGALAWDNSQDFWFVWTAGTSDTYNIRTCENGYDTSMVIYEGSCSNQIACNGDFGDGSGNNGECTAWYSQIDLDTTAGSTYYIRLGGWQADFGAGTLNINVQAPPMPGACCLAGGDCLDNLDSDSCTAFGGVFAGEDTVCADDPCGASGGFADECADAGPAVLGANAFDTSLMTGSEPQPDDTQCEGTYLDWGGSADGWFAFTAGSTATHTFTTCDAASYDTSMVLYEGNCDTQVACNGDGSGGSGCQSYYSQLDYACTAGSTYYIRLGGWQGEIGSGTLTISVDDPNAMGACCDMGACLGDMTEVDCGTAGGSWNAGETCATFACPQPACPGAQVSQNVHTVDDGWSAGTSSNDPTGGAVYTRAELVNLASMSDLSVWGLQLFYDGAGWVGCTTDYGFNVRAYDDAGGMPGAESASALNVAAVKTATGDLYAGAYEGFRFDMDFAATNVGWVSVQSESDGLGCWFLWMSSGIGDGDSALDDGTGWVMGYGFDLSLCIN
jgi:hypothetical protein